MGKSKIILEIDENGNEIGRYTSASDASRKLGISLNAIYKCCKGKQYAAYGHRFKYTGDFSDEKKPRPIKCPYCGQTFESYNGLCKHIFRFKTHGDLTDEQLLTDYKYGGVRPTCKCGCGQYTSISYQGGIHFNDYIKGHQSRVHNNWGHNHKAIGNSAKTRREQYKTGVRVQWNKGKKWKDTYDEETIQRLLASEKSDERRKKISDALSGKPKSDEHRKKMIANMQKDEEFKISSQLEDEFAKEFMDSLGVEYQRQYYIEEIRQFCDFYVPSRNLVVECDGNFWHANPAYFPNGPVYDCQKEKAERDKIKEEYLINHGYKLIRLWEDEIIEEPDKVRTKLNEAVTPQ